MPAVTRRQYKGAAAQTTITNALTSSDTSATLAATTGWPSTASVPFYVVISPGTASEEKCLATISGSVLTLTRAQDDTTAQTHASGATIYPVFTADDADEANKLASTLTTRGDLLVMGSGPDFARLGIGASGRVLKSDGTDPAWAVDPASDLVTTKGDLLVGSAADTLARLAAGTNEHRLVADSAATNGLKYVADTTNYAVGAKGDILVGTGADTVAAVTVGTNDHVLTADSSTASGVKWAAVSPAGLTLVKSQTIGSGVSSVEVTSAFSADYDNYLVIVSGGSTTADATLSIQFGSTTTGYKWVTQIVTWNSPQATNLTGSSGGSNINYVAASSGTTLSGHITILNPYLTENTFVIADSLFDGDNGGGWTRGILDNTTSYTSFTLASGSAMTGGTIKVYGYKN